MTKARKLEVVREDLGDCRRCGLCEGRKNIVFGSGSPTAPLMFVGEGPGADEDEQGLPFVGKAGELLTRMIESIGWTRDTVYIANVIKCRPTDEDGQNRPGSPEEVAACLPFLRKQIAAIEPLVIVTMGNLATRSLLGIEDGITRIRGKWRDMEMIEVLRYQLRIMPTFHPAYLLRAPGGKKYVWKDLLAVVEELGKHDGRGPNGVWTRHR